MDAACDISRRCIWSKIVLPDSGLIFAVQSERLGSNLPTFKLIGMGSYNILKRVIMANKNTGWFAWGECPACYPVLTFPYIGRMRGGLVRNVEVSHVVLSMLPLPSISLVSATKAVVEEAAEEDLPITKSRNTRGEAKGCLWLDHCVISWLKTRVSICTPALPPSN